jgi:predicted Ser/Thr protein kinase
VARHLIFLSLENLDPFHEMAKPHNNLKGRRIGPYAVEEEIGRGGMGVVYRARDTDLKRTVALKVLRRVAGRDHAVFLERFRREAQVMALLDHPNIARIYSFGEWEGTCYFAMEYLSGRALADEIKARGLIEPNEAVGIARMVARALCCAHGAGVLHRDIKPANIVLCGEDRVVVTDFGLSKTIHGRKITENGEIFGTPEYLSPEQAAGREPDARSDVYALGVVLYEMLTGQAPFEGGNVLGILHRQKTEPPRPPRALSPSIPKNLEAIVLRTLAKDPDQRFASADAFLAALDAFQKGESPRDTDRTSRGMDLREKGLAGEKVALGLAEGIVEDARGKAAEGTVKDAREKAAEAIAEGAVEDAREKVTERVSEKPESGRPGPPRDLLRRGLRTPAGKVIGALAVVILLAAALFLIEYPKRKRGGIPLDRKTAAVLPFEDITLDTDLYGNVDPKKLASELQESLIGYINSIRGLHALPSDRVEAALRGMGRSVRDVRGEAESRLKLARRLGAAHVVLGKYRVIRTPEKPGERSLRLAILRVEPETGGEKRYDALLDLSDPDPQLARLAVIMRRDLSRAAHPPAAQPADSGGEERAGTAEPSREEIRKFSGRLKKIGTLFLQSYGEKKVEKGKEE